MESPASIPCASPPFDNPCADTILCSSDNVEFHVHSIILAEASPFFKAMFMLPQPTATSGGDPDSRDGRPVVRLTEDSHTLDGILRLCYPIADPVPAELPKARAMLEAAIKYQMEESTSLMARELERLAPTQYLQVWAIACRLELESTALHAANCALSQKIEGIFVEEMLEISAGAYFRLLQFHRSKGAVALPYDFHRSDGSQVPPCPEGAHAVYSFTSPSPDIMCRSFDGHEFPVHQLILIMASPLLQQMVTDIVPPGRLADSASDSELPVLDFPGVDSGTLAALLKLCYYPEEASDIARHSALVRGVLRAATRFKMQRAIDSIEKELVRCATSEPLRIYLIAVEFAFDECARLAAQHTLHHKIEDIYIPEMEDTPARAYFRLLKYHKACATAISARVTSLQVPVVVQKVGDTGEKSGDERAHARKQCGRLSKSGRVWYGDYSSNCYQCGTSFEPPVCDECSKVRYSPLWLHEHLQSVYTLPGVGVDIQSMLAKSVSESGTWCSGCQQLAERLDCINTSLGPSGISNIISTIKLEM